MCVYMCGLCAHFCLEACVCVKKNMDAFFSLFAQDKGEGDRGRGVEGRKKVRRRRRKGERKGKGVREGEQG